MIDNVLVQNCLRCKKIKYALCNGSSIEAIQEIFKEEVQKKVLNKSYDSIGHLSKSRLGESDSHIDKKQEFLLTEKLPPVDCILYIEEKMDGSNCAVIRKNGEIIAIGRSGYRCSDSNFEQHRMFHRYIEKRKQMFESILSHEGDRVVGEWLAMAHGTLYSNIISPYQVFDFFRDEKRLNFEERKKIFDTYGLSMVPLLYKGKEAISIEKALDLALTHNSLAEGVVYRLEIFDKKINTYKPFLIAKVVRMDKEDGKYFSDTNPIWMWNEEI